MPTVTSGAYLSDFFGFSTPKKTFEVQTTQKSTNDGKDTTVPKSLVSKKVIRALSNRLKVNAPQDDQDSDGLSDSLEGNIGTNASEKDSDFDGLLDSVEYYATGQEDLDGDGRLSVLDADSDGDLLPDYYDVSPYSVLLAPRSHSLIDFSRTPIPIGRVDMENELVSTFQLGSNQGPHAKLIYNEGARTFSYDNITRQRYLKFVTVVEWDVKTGDIRSTGFMPPLGASLFKASWTTTKTYAKEVHRGVFSSYYLLNPIRNTFGWGTTIRWGDCRWRIYQLDVPGNTTEKKQYTLTTTEVSGLVLITDVPLYSDSFGVIKPDLRRVPKVFEYFPISRNSSIQITLQTNLRGGYDFEGVAENGAHAATYGDIPNDRPLYVYSYGYSIQGAGNYQLSEPNRYFTPAFTLVDALVDYGVPGGKIVREVASPYALLGLELKNVHSSFRGFIPFKPYLEDVVLSETKNRINVFQNQLIALLKENSAVSKKTLYQDYLNLLDLVTQSSDLVGFPSGTETYKGKAIPLKDMLLYGHDTETYRKYVNATFKWTKNLEDVKKTIIYAAVRKQLVSVINLDSILTDILDRAWINVSFESIPWKFGLQPRAVSDSKLDLIIDTGVRFDAVEGPYVKARLDNFKFLDALDEVSSDSRASLANLLADTDFPTFYRQMAFSDTAYSLEIKEDHVVGINNIPIANHFSVLTQIRYVENPAAADFNFVTDLLSTPSYQGFYLLDNVGIGHPRSIHLQTVRNKVIKYSDTSTPVHTSPYVGDDHVLGENDWWKNASYIVGVTDSTRLVWGQALLADVAYMVQQYTEYVSEWYDGFDVPSDLWESINNFRDTISDWKYPFEMIDSIFNKIQNLGSKVKELLDNSEFRQRLDTIREYIRAFRSVFQSFDFIGKSPLSPVLDVFGIIDNAIGLYDAFKKFAEGVADFWDAVSGVMSAIYLAMDMEAVSALLQRVTGIGLKLVPRFLGVLMTILGALDAGMAIGDRITGNNRGGLIGWLKDLWGMLKLGYKEGWGHLWKAYKEALKDQWSNLMNKFANFFKKVGDWIKKLMDLFKSKAKEQVAAEKPDDSLYPIVSTAGTNQTSIFASDRPYIDSDETFYYLAANLISEYNILPPLPEKLPSAPYASDDNLGRLLGEYYTLEGLPPEKLNMAMFTTALTIISTIGKSPRLETSPASILLQSSIPAYLEAKRELEHLRNWINTWVNVSSRLHNVPTDALGSNVPPWIKDVFEYAPVYDNFTINFTGHERYLLFLKEFYPGIYYSYLQGEMSLYDTEEAVAARLDPQGLAYQYYLDERMANPHAFAKFISRYWLDAQRKVYEAALEVQRDYLYGADVVILGSGYSKDMFNLLTEHFNVIPRVLPLEQFNYVEALTPQSSVLIIPTGALRIDDQQAISYLREQFEKYLSEGGTIIVFPQARTIDYQTLPYYNVNDPSGSSGYAWGYNDYRGCLEKSATVGIGTHPIVAPFNASLVDLGLDGAIVTWPVNAKPILTRTTGEEGKAALLSYPWGAGRVILTTTYTDFRYGSTKTITNDEKMLLEALLNYAMGKQKDSMSVFEKGDDSAKVTITFKNPFRDSVTWLAKLVVLDPHGEPRTVLWQNLSLAVGESVDVTLPLNISDDAPPGIYTVQVTYYGNYGRTVRDSYALQFAIKEKRDEITAVQTSYDFTTKKLNVSVTFNIQHTFNGDLSVLAGKKNQKYLTNITFQAGTPTIPVTIENASLIPGVTYPLTVTVYSYQENESGAAQSLIRMQRIFTFSVGTKTLKVSLTASNTVVEPNNTVTFTIKVDNEDTTYNLEGAQVTFDVYAPISAGPISTTTFKNITINAGSSTSKTANWTVPSDATSGLYTAKATLSLNNIVITSSILTIKVANGTDAVIKSANLDKTKYYVAEQAIISTEIAATGASIVNAYVRVIVQKGSTIVSQTDSDKFNLTKNSLYTLQMSFTVPDTPAYYSVFIYLKNGTGRTLDSSSLGIIEVKAKVYITQIYQLTSPIIAGTPATFTVTIKNNYTSSLQVKVQLFSNNKLDTGESSTITLTSGETRNVTLNITIQGVNRNAIEVHVTDLSNNIVTQSSLSISPKAPIEITSYSVVSPSPYLPYAPIDIQVTIKNYKSTSVNYLLNTSISPSGIGNETQSTLNANQALTLNISVTPEDTGTYTITLNITDTDAKISANLVVIVVRVTSDTIPGVISDISLEEPSGIAVAGEQQVWKVTIFNNNNTDPLTFNVSLYYQEPWQPTNLILVGSQNVTVDPGLEAYVYFNVTLPQPFYQYNLTAVLIPPYGTAQDQDNYTITTALVETPLSFESLEPNTTLIIENQSSQFVLTLNNVVNKTYLNLNMTLYARLENTSNAWQLLDWQLVNVSALVTGAEVLFNVTFPDNGTWRVLANCTIVNGVVESINRTVDVLVNQTGSNTSSDATKPPIFLLDYPSAQTSSSANTFLAMDTTQPEVKIVSITFDKASYNAGDTALVDIVLTNSGSTDANVTLIFDLPTIYYYVKKDVSITAGSSTTITISFVIGNGLLTQTYTGTAYVFSSTQRIDYKSFSISIQSYSLDISLSLDQSVYSANDTMEVSFQINNTGALDISGGILSINLQIPGVTTSIHQEASVTLQKGQSNTYNFTVAVPSEIFSGQGVLSYTVTVEGMVIILGHYYIMYKGVEPVTASVTLDKVHLNAGDDLSGTITVTNNYQGSITVNLTLSVADVATPFEKNQFQIAANSNASTTFVIDLPAEMSQGVYEALLIIKDAHTSAYLVVMTIRFTMDGPNIVEDFFAVNATATVNAGDDLQVNVTMRNAGNFDTSGTLLIQLLDEAGNEIDNTTKTVSLSVGDSLAATNTISIPSSAYGGTYLIKYLYQSSSGAVLLQNAKIITVSGQERAPQISISLISVNETVLGNAINFGIRVVNVGGYTAQNITVIIYGNITSSGSTLTATGTTAQMTQLYSVSVDSISPFESYYVTRTISIQDDVTNLSVSVLWKDSVISSDSLNVYAADAPPVIGSIYTVEERNFAALPVTIRAYVVDNVRTENVILYYRFTNDSSWQQLDMTPDYSRTLWSASVPTTTDYTTLYYYLKATDNAGLSSTSEQKSTMLYSDQNAPLMTVDIYPTDDIISGIVNITISSDDQLNGSGIGSITVTTNNKTIFSEDYGTLTLTRRITYQWNSSEVNDGNHTLLITVKDRIGNTNQTTILLDIDNNAPFIPEMHNKSLIKEFMLLTGDTLKWKPSDAHPQAFNLTINGKLVVNGSWDGSPITYSLVKLTEGTYIFNLTVTDMLNRSSFSVVKVTVTSQLIPIVGSIILLLGGIIASIAYIRKKNIIHKLKQKRHKKH